jgi:Ca2+-binding RTX toxin-like protein
VNNANDVVQDATGAAATVVSSASFVLPTNVNELVLTGSANLAGTANAGADTLVSNSGVDTLVGGAGNDLFVVNNGGDVVRNASIANSDTVQSSVSYTLAANVNTLELTGTAALLGTANSGADTLVSNAGVDTLVGGTGNDVFVVHNAADLVQNASSSNSDTILSSVGITLPTHVNSLVLTGSADLAAAGNGSADLLTANAGSDTLMAVGAATTLVGGTGNDLFVINDATDVVSNGNAGVNDTLQSSVSVTAPINVDTVVLTGAGNLTAKANGDRDTLVSNSGIDTLYGGTGNDVFVVNNAADVLVGVKAGDTIVSSVTYAMPSGVNAMSLAVQSGVSGAGNAAGQTLSAGGSNDTLIAAAPTTPCSAASRRRPTWSPIRATWWSRPTVRPTTRCCPPRASCCRPTSIRWC